MLAFRDVTDTRERQVGAATRSLFFTKSAKASGGHVPHRPDLVVGDGHGGLRELYRRDVDNIADKGDFLAFTFQRIEG